jgi:hypothetical protein
VIVEAVGLVDCRPSLCLRESIVYNLTSQDFSLLRIMLMLMLCCEGPPFF